MGRMKGVEVQLRYSYRSASTGSMREARHAGGRVATKLISSDQTTTMATSLHSMRAGMRDRK